MMMAMADFFARCGDLLLTEQQTWGKAPQRHFAVKWHYEFGWARYHEAWEFYLYTPEEQAQRDAESAQMDL